EHPVPSALADKQPAPVLREDDAVGIGEPSGEAAHVAPRSDVIDAASRSLGGGVSWVGEVKASAGIEREIVRSVERLPVDVGSRRADLLSLLVELQHRVSLAIAYQVV